MKLDFSSSQLEKISAKANEALILGDKRAFNRAKALELLGSGIDKDDVAHILRVSVKTLGRYIFGFIVWGTSFLTPVKSSGRPSKLSNRQLNSLKEWVLKGPSSCGFPGGSWTAAMLCDFIFKKYGVIYSAGYLPQLMKRIGFSWQKSTTRNYRQDAEKLAEWKVSTWPKILQKAKKRNARIFFEDECSFALASTEAYTWARRGEQPVVPTTGSRKCTKVYGAIEYYSGRLIARLTEEQLNGESYKDFLKYVLKRTRGKLIWIHDGVAYHKSKEIKKFLTKTNRIEMILLPPYCPELNPIEKLWKKFKQKGTHNKFFKCLKDLKNQVSKMIGFFENNPAEVLSLMPS